MDISERGANDVNRRSIGDHWVFWEAMLPLRWQHGDLLEAVQIPLFWLSPRTLRAHVEACQRLARELQPASFRAPMDKDTYRQINGAMKPLLKKIGYRSLAQLISVHGPL